jgi:predicted PurR-regulated permease PerM
VSAEPNDRAEIDRRRDRLLASLALIAGIGLVLAIPFALRAGAEFFLPLTAAIVIAIALVPFLEWMERRSVPSGVAALAAVVIFLTVANTALVLIIVPAADWFQLLPARIGQIQANLAPVIDFYSQLQRRNFNGLLIEPCICWQVVRSLRRRRSRSKRPVPCCNSPRRRRPPH